jgi:hypothetical protein
MQQMAQNSVSLMLMRVCVDVQWQMHQECSSERKLAVRFGFSEQHIFPYHSLSSTDKQIYDDGVKRLQYVRIWRRGRKCSRERP